MKTKILPTIWYVVAVVSFFGVMTLGGRFQLNGLLSIAIAWLVSILAALFLGSVVISWKPDFRFSTKKQVDGLGYIHEPMWLVVHVSLIAIICVFLNFFKK